MGLGMFFLDTYAFVALDKESKNYWRFRDVDAVTTRFNQAEYGWLLIKEGKPLDIEKLEPYIFEVNSEIVKNALRLRKKHKNMSMPDAIGYATSVYLTILFVTGDSDFKGLPNVLFFEE